MPEYPSIVAVCHEVVKKPPNSLDAATVADLVGRSYATLMSELSCQPGHKLAADLILPICFATGSNLPVKAMCRALNAAFIPLKHNPQDVFPAGFIQTLSITVRDFGEFAAEAADDISDGKIQCAELPRIKQRASEAIEAILLMVRLATENCAECGE